MVDDFKIAIFLGLAGAILLYPEVKTRTTNSKEFMQGIIMYLILFTIVGFIATQFIGRF